MVNAAVNMGGVGRHLSTAVVESLEHVEVVIEAMGFAPSEVIAAAPMVGAASHPLTAVREK